MQASLSGRGRSQIFTFNDIVVSRIRPKSDKVGTKILLRENLFRGLSVPPAVQLWKANLRESNTGAHRISFAHPLSAEYVLYGRIEG